MTPQFYREFLRASSMNARKALAVMNPVKCWAMDRLLDIHEKRGDKIIVFSGEWWCVCTVLLSRSVSAK